MPAANWHNLLPLFLWVSPHALLGVLAIVLFRHRLYLQFPFFLAYVLYEIAEFILLFALRSIPAVTGEQYAYAYSGTLLLSVALRFGVIDEVSQDLFRKSPLLKVVSRRFLRCATGLLLVMGVLLTIWAPGDSSVRFMSVSVVNRGAAMVQCGLLLSLFLFARFIGLTWRRPTFGIALGLGALSSVDIAAHAVRAQFTSSWVPYLNLMITGAYLSCVLIWIGYLLVAESQPASLAAVPPEYDEVETWNKELQHLLRH